MAHVSMQPLTDDRCDVECLHPEAVRLVLGRTLSLDAARSAASWFDSLAEPTRARILQALTRAAEPADRRRLEEVGHR